MDTPGELYETARALEAQAARKERVAEELRRCALRLPAGAVIAADLVQPSMWEGSAATQTNEALSDQLNPIHAAIDDLLEVARELDAETDALRDEAYDLRRQAERLERLSSS